MFIATKGFIINIDEVKLLDIYTIEHEDGESDYFINNLFNDNTKKELFYSSQDRSDEDFKMLYDVMLKYA